MRVYVYVCVCVCTCVRVYIGAVVEIVSFFLFLWNLQRFADYPLSITVLPNLAATLKNHGTHIY